MKFCVKARSKSLVVVVKSNMHVEEETLRFTFKITNVGGSTHFTHSDTGYNPPLKGFLHLLGGFVVVRV